MTRMLEKCGAVLFDVIAVLKGRGIRDRRFHQMGQCFFSFSQWDFGWNVAIEIKKVEHMEREAVSFTFR